VTALIALDIERAHAVGAHVRQVHGLDRIGGATNCHVSCGRRPTFGFQGGAQMVLHLALDAILRLAASRRYQLRDLLQARPD
jgi:hypothetical protein